jgi:hypothetical protein
VFGIAPEPLKSYKRRICVEQAAHMWGAPTGSAASSVEADLVVVWPQLGDRLTYSCHFFQRVELPADALYRRDGRPFSDVWHVLYL